MTISVCESWRASTAFNIWVDFSRCIAEFVGGPSLESVLVQALPLGIDLLDAAHGVGDVVRLDLGASEATALPGAGRRAPVFVVDLENAVVPRTVRIRFARDVRAVSNNNRNHKQY